MKLIFGCLVARVISSTEATEAVDIQLSVNVNLPRECLRDSRRLKVVAC